MKALLRLVNVVLALGLPGLDASINRRHLLLAAFSPAVNIVLLSCRGSEIKRTCRGIGTSVISCRSRGRADRGADLRHAFEAGRFGHALDFAPKGVQLLLHAAAEHVDVESCAVPAGPGQDDEHECRRRPAGPEPERAGNHREQCVQVLDAHEDRLLQAIGHGEDEFAKRVVLVALAEEGE